MPWNTHFANIQPDNSYGQDFLLMSGYGWGTWNDASGISQYSFICEIVMPWIYDFCFCFVLFFALIFLCLFVYLFVFLFLIFYCFGLFLSREQMKLNIVNMQIDWWKICNKENPDNFNLYNYERASSLIVNFSKCCDDLY